VAALDRRQSTVARAEAGKQALRLAEAVDLAAILGTTLDELTAPTPEADAAETVLRAAADLQTCGHAVSRAVAALLTAREQAGEALKSSEDTRWGRVRALREVLAEDYDLYTLEGSVEHGKTRHEASTDEGQTACWGGADLQAAWARGVLGMTLRSVSASSRLPQKVPTGGTSQIGRER
jgi:hypothetical protein